MRRFAAINLMSDRIPDGTTIQAFRHLLEKHELGEQIFETVNAYLKDRGMEMRQGAGLDADAAERLAQRIAATAVPGALLRSGRKWSIGLSPATARTPEALTGH